MDIRAQAMIAELEAQRNQALTRCGEWAALVATMRDELDSVKKELAASKAEPAL